MDVNVVNSMSSYGACNDKGCAGMKTRKTDKEVRETKGSGVKEEAAVYEKSTEVKKDSAKQIYSMNKADRSALVDKLKEEQLKRQNQLVDLVRQMISKQGSTYSIASDDDMWKFLASGNFNVDAETKAQAQAEIAEDGYWGVEQTSQRIVDFAMALAGDDEKAMRKMQAAFEKGFRQATGAWGKELPDISQKTYKAVNDKFDAYFESKKTAE